MLIRLFLSVLILMFLSIIVSIGIISKNLIIIISPHHPLSSKPLQRKEKLFLIFLNIPNKSAF